MDALLDLLNTTLFELLGTPVTVVEAFAFVTGALCVWAVSRQWIWNWPVGILNAAAFVVLFLGAGLYADASLQFVFIVLGVVGWVGWTRRRRNGAAEKTPLPVRRVRPAEAALGAGAVVGGTAAVALLLTTHTDSTVPWPDAFVLAASLVATALQTRKIFEHWWVWIAVDVVSIPLYLVKGLWLTAILYAGFLALCVSGLVAWRRDLPARPAQPTPPHPVEAAPVAERA